jgi:flagellar biosynthetic protein FlhB
MAHESGSKTEKPTAKRLADARQKGQVPKSMDLNSAVVLTAAVMLLTMAGPYTFVNLYGQAQNMLAHPYSKPLTQIQFISLLTSTLTTIGLLVLPLLLGTMLVGVLINVIQVKPLFTLTPLKPKFDKINPLNGFKRLWSLRSVVEAVKSIIKMTVVGSCGYSIIQSHWKDLMILGDQDVLSAWSYIVKIISEIGIWTCIIFFVFGLADWWYQIYEYQKQLRMTKHEVKQERKEQELDPTLKGRIRQMGSQYARKRQLAAVPKADVVITNPTHFAVAIQYDPDLAPAPRVIAKGQDHFALKIKEVAKENKVPVVENKPLARSLYAMVDVDRMIPPELFLAVAEVLAFVFTKNKGRKKPKGPN